jgi:hypothetical protein
VITVVAAVRAPEPDAVRAVVSVLPLQGFGDALDEALRAGSWTRRAGST